MLLALDLGNTSLTAGIFDDASLVRRFKVRVSDFGELSERLRREVALAAVDRVALASVNPSRVQAVCSSVKEVLPEAKSVLIGRDFPVPVEARVDHPDEVGVDRLLDALAAYARVKGACLVADFGTALTLDVVSSDGAYLGGVIAPGMWMSAAALHTGTALLPEVTPKPVARVTGTNTVACIRSGLYHGTLSMVEGLVARLKAEHPDVRRVLATGGDATLFADALDVIDEVQPDLTLEGIRLTLEGANR